MLIVMRCFRVAYLWCAVETGWQLPTWVARGWGVETSLNHQQPPGYFADDISS